MKRFFDFTISLCALLVLVIPMLIIAALVKITSEVAGACGSITAHR